MAEKRRSSTAGDETRARILEATLTTLKEDGIVGASARAIARRGDFNQALIFYHFGSVDDAIVAAVNMMSVRRLENHRDRLEGAATLRELVDVARALHHDDTANDNMTVLTQAFAGAAGDPVMGPKLYAALSEWSDMVTASIRRVLGDSPIANLAPAEQIGQGISALFLGIELLADLDADNAGIDALFDTLMAAASMVELLIAGGLTPPAEKS
ncbi:MAG: TetR family transcriptional regulator [Acidimicrobiales bacterium]|nr:MAG: TetR family transcriptional regulator [Acidimicrobiales bacterium]